MTEHRNTTTITMSIPKDFRAFFDELTEAGYNLSQLMVIMARILEKLYRQHSRFPGGLPRAIDALAAYAASGAFANAADSGANE